MGKGAMLELGRRIEDALLGPFVGQFYCITTRPDPKDSSDNDLHRQFIALSREEIETSRRHYMSYDWLREKMERAPVKRHQSLLLYFDSNGGLSPPAVPDSPLRLRITPRQGLNFSFSPERYHSFCSDVETWRHNRRGKPGQMYNYNTYGRFVSFSPSLQECIEQFDWNTHVGTAHELQARMLASVDSARRALGHPGVAFRDAKDRIFRLDPPKPESPEKN